MFIGACGRTDFQAGDTKKMYESLRKLSSLPDDTLVYPAHDYNGRGVSSISEQKISNKILQMDFEEFKAEIDSWNLPHPKQINESVPANLSCGEE